MRNTEKAKRIELFESDMRNGNVNETTNKNTKEAIDDYEVYVVDVVSRSNYEIYGLLKDNLVGRN